MVIDHYIYGTVKVHKTCIALVAVLCTSSEKWVFVKKSKLIKMRALAVWKTIEAYLILKDVL